MTRCGISPRSRCQREAHMSWRFILRCHSGRSRIFPDVPTVAEAGLPGYEVGSWWGLVAPAGTPSSIIQHAERVVVSFLREASTAARFLELALEPGELGAEAFQRFIATEKD